MKIRILPENVYSLIAAGEVIDRPASVVRELMQNSIDAGASQITLSLENGGKSLISVIDDGCGMDEGDLKIAALKHSTSKISKAEDMHEIMTYGFRGEALNSVSLVSDFKIESSPREEGTGNSIAIKFGEAEPVIPSSVAAGTMITVRDIFSNMPGRKRFLKSDNVEHNYCEKEFMNLAMANPDISFKLIADGRVSYNLKNATLEKRMSEIKGEEFIRNALTVNYFDAGIRVYGFVGKAPIFDNKRFNFSYVFVNKRSVLYPQIKRAVYMPFGSQLSRHFTPYILFIEIDAKEIDVNIHPAKKEVRFYREDRVFSAVSMSVRESLRFFERTSETINRNDEISTVIERPESFVKESSLFADVDYVLSEKTSETKVQEYSRFWQYNDSYILVNLKDKLYFIDQHAAHERIMFERVVKESGKILSQQLLFPFIARLPSELYDFYDSNKLKIENWGFTVREFDKMKLLVEGIPAVITENFEQNDFLEFLTEIKQTGSSLKAEEVSKIIACKAAIKAGKKLKINEMEDLFNQLFLCENPYSCPHGRPTFITFDKDEVGRWFRR
ncbi:MAG: DNA mismatch repair endonuclease MutL [bacterium]